MLLSHDKPLHEILNPNIKNQMEVFEKQFQGMTNKDFNYAEHEKTLNNLVGIIKEKILPYKQSLLNLVSLKGDLSDFKINNLEKLPAIKWKIKNLQKLQSVNIEKFEEQYNQLFKYFEGIY